MLIPQVFPFSSVNESDTSSSRYILLLSFKERDYLKKIQEEYVKRCIDSRAETVIAAIDTERDQLRNKRVDVDAAKLRYTSVNTVEEMKVGFVQENSF